MKTEEFIIVLCHECDLEGGGTAIGAEELLDKIRKLGYETEFFSNAIRRKNKYRYVVSNHRMEGSSLFPGNTKEKFTKEITNIKKRFSNYIGFIRGRKKVMLIHGDPVQYPPLQIGVKQIRFMYGADISDGWSLEDWNNIYDLFLCHGSNDAAELNKRFKGKTEIMGYPRYDSYFNRELDISSVLTEFDIDSKKRTILWMPTTGQGACSIPEFAEQIASLMDRFNVVVRPHPLSFRTSPEYIELLASLNYKIDSNPLRDMNVLYKAIDFVLCDYGGSSFGAIYLDKNLILLDVSNSESSGAVINSSNLQIREYFPVIGPEDAGKIESMIDDHQLWEEQRINRKLLFKKYFADNRGESSRQAAKILGSLDTILI
ncbi:MAG: CDP-glycerol glycerophosphotransferase family protein [Desulfuromusa sp.]|nr:CDP-glycerol glycerophosphotransferase family protein [Desulfuromusa sp.]